MLRMIKESRWTWLALGLLGGLVVGGLWPHAPLHAVATDRFESFAIATGPVDGSVEAVYFLDFLTGDLRAAVLGMGYKFNAFFNRNILMDFGLQPGQQPRFTMVTGVATDLTRGMSGQVRPGQSVVYVAEETTGVVCAYGLPWDSNSAKRNVPIQAALVLFSKTQFRTAAIRPTGPAVEVVPGEAAPAQPAAPGAPAAGDNPAAGAAAPANGNLRRGR